MTEKPAALSAFVASAVDLPVTSGTLTCGVPRETLIVTRVPFATFTPALGLSEITWPFGCVESCLTEETLKPASSSVDLATLSCLPTTSGTATSSGPELTTTWTRDPTGTWLSATGVVEITRPRLTSELCSNEVFANRPCFLRILIAWSSGFPVTSGTLVRPGPLDTLSLTVDDFSTVFPAVGSWETTIPIGRKLFTRTISGRRPTLTSCAAACGASRPTSFGTFTWSGRVSRYASAAPPSRRNSSRTSHGQRLRPSSSGGATGAHPSV